MNQHRNRITVLLPIFLLGVAGRSPRALAQSPGTFTATANMTTARRFHTATLLMDGRVLITGGENDSQPDTPLFTAEIYDPVTQTFTPSGNMMTGRGYVCVDNTSSEHEIYELRDIQRANRPSRYSMLKP